MTKQELNRDIKRLHKAIANKSSNPDGEYYKYIETTAKNEFTRLYHAADNFEALTKQSILIMFRLNLRHRFVAFHNFGLTINY